MDYEQDVKNAFIERLKQAEPYISERRLNKEVSSFMIGYRMGVIKSMSKQSQTKALKTLKGKIK